MIKRALHMLPGIVILMMGLLAMIGWHFRLDFLLRPGISYMPITYGGSFCFFLSGLALLCFPFSSYYSRLIQLISGTLIFLVAFLTLSEYLFHVDLGIDHIVDSSWIKMNTIYPGRIAFSTSIGFLFTGLIFILYYFAFNKIVAILIETCIFLLFIIGMLSLVGYFLNIEILYNWSTYTSMSLYSGFAFTLLGICVWYFWRKSPYCDILYRGREDKKLMLLSTVLVVTLTLIIGITYFNFTNQQIALIKTEKHIFPIILFVVVVGLLLLRLEIVPLIRRMSKAEKELIQSNARLKKSEERYALAVRGSNSGLWDWEIGTDNIFLSPYLKNLLGYTDEELPDKLSTFMERLHPDDVTRADTAIREHIARRVPYDIEYRLKRKSGEYHWFHVVGQAKWDETGRATRMVGSISDVTERKVIERRLAMQYSITQILSEADNLQDAVSEIIHKICTGLKWNYGAIWLVDHDNNKLSFLSAWHEPDVKYETFLQCRKKFTFNPGVGLIGRVWNTRKPYWNANILNDPHFMHKEEAKNANLNSSFCFPMLLENNVFGILEFFSHDIDSPDENLLQMMAAIGPQISQFVRRKYVEKELRQSEAHKSAILNSASDGIITITDGGAVVSFNLQTEKMFGYTAKELINKNINELIPGLTERARSIANKLPVEFLGINKNGDNFPAELTVSGMRMNKKNIYVIIVRDITERKKVEQLKNEFVSVVSHELRTPLTSIRGSLGLILGGVVGEFSEKAKNLLNIANNNCERLLHLINDILDIEKMESGKMNFTIEPVDISKIVKESIAANQMYGEKFGVKIKLVESVSGVLVNADYDRMLQVMANLISNAVKFSKQGDSVDLAIKVLNQKVRVSVTDYGSGIPANFQKSIFQKFSQADTTSTRGKGGTGLGLNITKSIIEKFGGTIDFISQENKKTVFYFDLPVHTEIKKDNEPANENATEEIKKSLLVCEDDEDQAKYIQAMLETTGFNVDIALTAHEARKLLAAKEYQGLLLDLILPDQDGISFIRELRNDPKTKKLPIIVMSVIANTGQSLMNGDAFSVLDWLDKPIDFSKLFKDVSAIKQGNHHIPVVMHVEDNPETRQLVKTLLNETANVISVSTLREAKIKLTHQHFDLVILDLLLPDGKGTELLPTLAKSGTPVIVFSATELDREHAEFVKDALVKSQTSHDKLFSMIEKIIHTSS